ncbi:hypothetical protein BCR42DRAFT_414547 [Absidia repens]|uniref:RRN6 beta-propeller domain-containing protein n=1 Tax=Absidia repens TaxID=90262 RepID=A0A1X2IJD3_9FUNG|nr:hypothetical protein BCR42DRAFT_414547 [Absidia repens]
MNFNKYDQRLPLVDPFEFGDKATLQNGTWQSIEQEEQVIPPTNTYMPHPLLFIKKSKNDKTKKYKPSLQQLRYKEQLEQYGGIINEQGHMEPLNDKNHNYHYNPFRSNSYAIGRLGKETYMVLPCGEFLTELRLVLMKTQNFSLKDDDGCVWTSDHDIPLGLLSSTLWTEMEYPILQIRISTALDVTNANVDTMIIGVRTIQNISMFKIVRDQQSSFSLELLHCFDPSIGNLDAPLCRPAHIVMSPYFGHQYAFVADDGYVAVFDILQMTPNNPNGVIYETDLQMVEGSRSHSRRWKSCVFGPHPRTLIVSSSRHAAILDFKTDKIYPEKLLYSCSDDQRIYCLESLESMYTFQFCISTKDRIIVMDTRYPNQPIISWKHHFNDSPPTFMELVKDPLNSDIVNILAWPLQQDSVIHLQYQYNGRLEFVSEDEPPYIKPAIFSRPNFIMLETYKTMFSYLHERIPVIGTALKTEILRCTETGQTKELAVIFRLLNNGAVYAQRFVTMDETYPDFDRPPPTRRKQHHLGWHLDASSQQHLYQFALGDGILEAYQKVKEHDHLHRHSMYHMWNSSAFFKGIMDRAITSKLSVQKTGVELHGSDILKVDFPTSIQTQHGFWQLNRQSLEEFDYDGNMDSAYQAISNNACNTLGNYNQIQKMNRDILNHYFASDMFARLMIYLPAPPAITTSTTDTNDQQFKYLRRKDETFEPTPSTLLMAHDWNISDSSSPTLKRRASTTVHSQEIGLPPAISSSFADISHGKDSAMTTNNDDFTSISTQPSAGAFANRKRSSTEPKKKKKKKVVSGFM